MPPRTKSSLTSLMQGWSLVFAVLLVAFACLAAPLSLLAGVRATETATQEEGEETCEGKIVDVRVRRAQAPRPAVRVRAIPAVEALRSHRIGHPTSEPPHAAAPRSVPLRC